MATTWVFERGSEHLRVQRQDVLGELRLVVWGNQMPDRIQVFDDEVQLVACMTALDCYLIAAGWSLVDFFPERRASRDPGAGRVDDRGFRVGSRYTGRSHVVPGQTAVDLART